MPHSIKSVINNGTTLNIHWQSGEETLFHAIWLRDHCHCDSCRSANNGQRFLDVSAIPEDLCISAAQIDAQGQLLVSFSPEAHQSSYSAERLQDYLRRVTEQPHDRCEADKTLWNGQSIQSHETRFDWAQYEDNSEIKLAALCAFRELGYFVLSNTPAVEGQVLKVIDSFGYLRDTNYGQLFEVRAMIDANNLAYTNVGLGAHADNPYRDPVPSIQALHCVENNVDGGESLLLDGFMAADILRRENAEHFNTLVNTPLHFCFADRSADLRARMPLITADELGRVTCVRYNNRSIDTIAVEQEKIPGFYRAYRHYAEILQRPELSTTFKLTAGDCMVFDNTRVMHARTAFSTGGQRHLQGAYSDLDGLYSEQRVLQQGLSK